MSVKVKICGLTQAEDIALALSLGVAYCGIIRFQDSPRYVVREKVQQLLPQIPVGKRVAVDVLPSVPLVGKYFCEGFDYCQIHFPADTTWETILAWSRLAGPERLWLAPKLPPEIQQFPSRLLPLADTFVVDGYNDQLYGGTGRNADWERFQYWQTQYPHKKWILAGGLRAENLREAIQRSGAEWVDLNSGVESAPGRKDPQKLRQAIRVIQDFVGI